ncbi:MULTISPECIES: hypothetical protein [Methylomonas]|uniref:Uncharacterized protein n=2 Tax=Methylomonas TaxID=416 RepID=A0A126T302_9GAMM|nr:MULTISPECIES: hypothetical protein [Methylomonas]AMK76447.1 hypothetical protein JT25_008070 [Methylomonas denitrificans]OAH98705.1 hypothetical protein A1342_12810 [Methylomonas methanica]TCV88481.1 hypothetical protein EDE11_101271 [Methylomonas methanica]
MAKSDYFPHSDNDLLVWHDRFKANLATRLAELGLSAEDITGVESDNQELHDKISEGNAASAAARHATAAKTASVNNIQGKTRALVRRIKAHPAYSDALGNLLGIIGSEDTTKLAEAKPVLTGVDQTGGVVVLNFVKSRSDGINIYCQREGESEFVFLARDTIPPYVDNRPLLVAGKPELRRYTAVYILKDAEVGQYSDELVVNCAP